MRIVLTLITLLQLSVLYSQNIKHIYLYNTMTSKISLYDGNLVTSWSYGYYDPSTHAKLFSSVPGPHLDLELGDSVIVHYWNDTGESHTIHWHGLDVDQANDGVPTTSSAVFPFDSTTYHFKATHLGNYLYHCHVHTSLHLQMGLYGGITVSDNSNEIIPGGPVYSNAYNFISSDLYAYWHEDITADYFMINGRQGQKISDISSNNVTCLANDQVSLNLFNIGYSISQWVFPEELNTVIYTSDGRPLPQSYSSDTLLVYPGERYAVMISPIADFQGTISVNYLDMFEFNSLETNEILVNIDPLGTSEKVNPKITIYPNPAKDYLEISLNEESLGKLVSLYDIRGVLIDTYIPEHNQLILNTSSLSKGLYFILLNNESPVLFVKE